MRSGVSVTSTNIGLMEPNRTQCAARYCEVRVTDGMLMCIKHWKLLPKPMQKELHKWHRQGAEQGVHPMTEYTAATIRCVNFIFEIERNKGQ